jgi:hypothetical protein
MKEITFGARTREQIANSREKLQERYKNVTIKMKTLYGVFLIGYFVVG